MGETYMGPGKVGNEGERMGGNKVMPVYSGIGIY